MIERDFVYLRSREHLNIYRLIMIQNMVQRTWRCPSYIQPSAVSVAPEI